VWGPGGGPEKTILLGTARTDRSRYEITVCYLRERGDPLFQIGERAQALGVDYVEVEERFSLDPRIWTQLKRLVKKHRIQIVHAHDYKTDLLALLLARRLGVIPLSTVHGFSGHSKKEAFYYAVDKKILTRFPHVITVSNDLRQCLLDAGAKPERVTTVLNAIEPDRFRRDPSSVPAARAKFGIGDDAIVLGSVGRLEIEKRFDILVRVFARIHAENPKVALMIAGAGSLGESLQQQIDSLGVGDACRLMGHLKGVPEFHHALDVYVQSSNNEGTPNAVLEAMALGTPVVATAAGGTADLLRDGTDGLLIPVGDEAGLERAIRTAVADADQRREWARSARQRIETDLSFANRMDSVERIYDKLMGRENLAPATAQ
jgi:glycosyltransferase involved in cell wall biosynthesis